MQGISYGRTESGMVIHLVRGKERTSIFGIGKRIKKANQWPSGDDLGLMEATCPRCLGKREISLKREIEELQRQGYHR